MILSNDEAMTLVEKNDLGVAYLSNTIEAASRCPHCKIVIFTSGQEVDQERLAWLRTEREAEDRRQKAEERQEEELILTLLASRKDTAEGLTLLELEGEVRRTHPTVRVAMTVDRLQRAGTVVRIRDRKTFRYSVT